MDVFKENLKKVNFIFLSNRMSSLCHSYVIRTSLVCTRMSSICHPFVTRMPSVCHSYVTRMYSYVISMSLVCIRVSSLCHSYVLVCYPYVTRLWFYHEPCQIPQSAQKCFYWRVQHIIYLFSRYFKLTKYIRI